MKLSIAQTGKADTEVECCPPSSLPHVLIYAPSTLDSIDDFPVAAGQIYRHRRLGRRISAIVADQSSADQLHAACGRIGLVATIHRPGEPRPDKSGLTIVIDPALADNGDGTPKQAPADRPLRISIAGFGVVGQALVARLRNEPRFEIVSILVRDPKRLRAVEPPRALTADIRAFLAGPTDIIVDVLSCEGTGAFLCGEVLPKGVHIVSASKRVISAGHERLSHAAAQGGSHLLYSAAVGGGAPVLETIARARAEGPIREVAGILNGTVNYILDRLAAGLSFAEALAEAQRAGFAEEDSSADLSGADAAAKIRLAAHQAFGIDPQSLSVTTEALDETVAARIGASGERWVQVARASRRGDTIKASVRLRPASEVEELPALPDEWNGAVVTLENGAAFRCIGRGAGGAATAEAIVADLYDIPQCRAPREAAELVAAC